MIQWRRPSVTLAGAWVVSWRFVLAEQHDLGAVILAAQQPRLLVLGEGAPEVGAAVRPALGFEAPAAVGVAFEAYQRPVALVPGAVFESVGVA